MFIDKRRQDLQLTSTGRSHLWVQPQNFSFNRSLTNLHRELPSILQENKVLPSEQYITTNQANHDYKPHAIQHNGYPLSKPLPHYKMQYNKDLHEKLLRENPRRALTMANSKSETTEEFDVKMGIKTPETYGMGCCKGLTLKEHFKSLPVLDNTKRSYSCGARCGPDQKKAHSIMLLNDPYMTTTMKVHRQFAEGEKIRDAGSKSFEPPLVKAQESPMLDKIRFKNATKIRTTPAFINRVPHSGLQTNYNDDFQNPLSMHKSNTSVCLPTYNIDHKTFDHQTPNEQGKFELKGESKYKFQKSNALPCYKRDYREPVESNKFMDDFYAKIGLSAFPIPSSYITEYQTVGSKRKVLV